MSRSGFETAASLAVLAACTSNTNQLAVCARGDRDVLAAQVTTIELGFRDSTAASVGEPVDLPPRDVHVGTDVPPGATSFVVTGFDASNAAIARGQGTIASDGSCACFALDTQAAAVCHAVTCKIVGDSCRFYGDDGSLLGSQTVGFGEAGDVTGVTTDTYLELNEPTDPHLEAVIEAGPPQSSPSTVGWRVGLFRFDLSALPRSATIDSATLVLHACPTGNCGTSLPLELHPVTQPWNANATWNDSIPGTPWSTPGCGSNASPPCGAVIGTVPQAALDETVSVPISPGQVASWVADPATNFGLIMLRQEQAGSAIHVDSSRTTSGRPPRLDVAFHLP